MPDADLGVGDVLFRELDPKGLAPAPSPRPGGQDRRQPFDQGGRFGALLAAGALGPQVVLAGLDQPAEVRLVVALGDRLVAALPDVPGGELVQSLGEARAEHAGGSVGLVRRGRHPFGSLRWLFRIIPVRPWRVNPRVPARDPWNLATGCLRYDSPAGGRKGGPA